MGKVIQDTRSTLHLTTTVQVLANAQLLHLTALRTVIGGFNHILNGHHNPDLILHNKIQTLFENLQTRARKKGFELVAKHSSDFYHYNTKFMTYTNLTTQELVLVVYLSPPIYRPGELFTLRKITLLPITYKDISTVLTLGHEKDHYYVATNLQNT